jgi:pimeloyl-ACP methyl ester carboxylesterase
MKHIYCISGFGADERVFSKLNFNYNEVHFIPWIDPLKSEPIEAYAKRMSEAIRHPHPVLFGLSFGGIMCIEIAKIIATSAVIIISSIKTFHEMPMWMRLTGKLQLDKILPLKTSRFIEPIENYNLGIENNDELKLVTEYRRTIGQEYTNWAAHQVVNWQNEWIPQNIYHIHGGKDHIFPIKNIKADYVIADGGHFMIMNRAEKVNSIIRDILK